MINERADKNTDAGNYQTKSNHYEAPEKKKSKKLDLSIGDVVALNPNSAWSPDPKKATGLYAVVTSIKTDDTVSVEAENGTVYKLFDINQFAKIKENLEPHTGPKWDADIKQRATFYVGQDKYDAHEILQLMAKEYQTTPEEISRITGLKESITTDKVKADAKKSNKAALGNLAKGVIDKSPAAKAVANRAGVSTVPGGKDYDADYYYAEGDKVRIDPKFSESEKGDVGIVKAITEKFVMVEIEGQGVVPVLRTDIKEAFGDNDENWNAFDEPTGDDPDELAAFAAYDDPDEPDEFAAYDDNEEDQVNDEIVDNIVDAVSREIGISYEEVLDTYSYDEILDAFETYDHDTDATVRFIASSITDDPAEMKSFEDWDNDHGLNVGFEDDPMFPEDEEDPRGREDMPPPGYGA